MRAVFVLLVGLIVLGRATPQPRPIGNAWHSPAAPSPGIAHDAVAGSRDRRRTPTWSSTAATSSPARRQPGQPAPDRQRGHLSQDHRRGVDDRADDVLRAERQQQVLLRDDPGRGRGCGNRVLPADRVQRSRHDVRYGTDDASHATVDEATAQAGAFAYGVEWALAPEARSRRMSMALAGEALHRLGSHRAGRPPSGLEIDLAPPDREARRQLAADRARGRADRAAERARAAADARAAARSRRT